MKSDHMTQAPERIWVDYREHTETYAEISLEEGVFDTGYVRGDLYEALEAENKRLHQGLHAVKELGANALAENLRLREILKECSDDLETENGAAYPLASRKYPSQRRRYHNDMEIVYRARKALEGGDT